MEELTIAQLQQQLASGALTVRELAQSYLDRIASIDRAGPSLNSVIELNLEALRQADVLDRERAEGRPLGALHGIPILLKDNIDTAGPMLTTAGSLALAGAGPAPADAFIVQRLRRAGALILGKTNLSEWANFRSTHSSSGWSSRGGQTRNPYALDRNPSGSSSGSAVAAAANLCAAAIGSETNGSIISPSQANGLVGIKPTVGLVSRTGMIPISHSQDTAGPMARTVADAAALLDVLARADPRDAVTLGAPKESGAGYTQYLDPDSARGMRIGVARNFFGFSVQVDQIMAGCLDALRGLGAELVDPVSLDLEALGESGLEVLLYEFKAGLNAYLAARGPAAPVHSLAELIDFNDRHRDQVMPYFGQEHLLQAEAKGPLTEEKYLQALAECRRLSREAGLDAVLNEHRLDAIVAPSGGPAWLTDWVNGDHYSGGSSSPAAIAGYPNITVPAGHIFGLPVGISFMGAAYQEHKLIRLAYAFEQATQARRPPSFLPSVPFGPEH